MSLTDKLKGTTTWALPILKKEDLEAHLARAKGYDEVKKVFSAARSRHDYERLEDRLRQHIERTVDENRNLYRFAKLVDTYDKALVPIDAVADYMKIMGGVGYGLSAAKELVELPAKAAYSAYYLGKTKDLKGFLYNLIYEGLSFAIPGSLLDLTNHYVKQAERYTVKNSVKRFVEEAQAESRQSETKSKPATGKENLKKAA